jgi:7-keto-8-aminopelargonate synthetase-like enzyme
MGTFSKALASIGGFIAADDEAVLEYLRHHSKPLIFSAALPASNTATVLTCLDILDEDPDRVTRLWDITRHVHAGYREIGLITKNSKSPIIPIYIGAEDRPGVIGAIGTTIGKHNINIARMTVGQEKERGQNIILLTTDTPVTPECLKDVLALEHVAMAYQLEL